MKNKEINSKTLDGVNIKLVFNDDMNNKEINEYIAEHRFNWVKQENGFWYCPERKNHYAEVDDYFSNSYWEKLRYIQVKLEDMPMKQSGSIFELEKRFKEEILDEQTRTSR